MKAAILHDFKKPLSIEEVERPHPEADEVLIQVEACGACHSDLHVADGDWTQLAGIVKRPLILGHEIAGRVVERGAAVQDLKIGDRVGVPWIYWTCGECEFCREGNENLCSRQKITGVTVDGGYAEFVKAPATHALKIPDGLSALEAAPLFCAGLTVYRALKGAGIVPGQRLAVFGIGGLGHLAVRSWNSPELLVQLTRSMRPRLMWLSSCAAKVESMCHLSRPPRRQLMTRLFPASGPPVLCSSWACLPRTSVSRRF
jgi:propanol-preferring alcohol dehydrogenase